MKKIIILVVVLFFLSGCSDKINFGECTKLIGEEKDACISIKASEAINIRKYSDGEICRLFDDEILSSNCYLNFGMKWGREDLCGNAKDDDKNFCLAVVKTDSAYCRNIASAGKKDDCFARLESEQQKNFDYANNQVHQEYATEIGKLQIYKGPMVNGEQSYYYMVDYDSRGKHYHEYVDQLVLNAVYWLTNNTPKDEKILAWWDYGHLIEGISGREAVFYAPSEKIYNEIYRKNGRVSSYFSSEDNYADAELMADFSKALISYDEKELGDFMKKHNTEYVLITAFEKDKMGEMLLSLDADKKINTEMTVLGRLLEQKNLKSFAQFYADDFARVYKLIS
ncbi:hypothetical protein JXA85_04165 [Candidatus Woesearchaeota archaeon]|nr:hypothetical protein [Candidatus Woesearchaeota archaeon]